MSTKVLFKMLVPFGLLVVIFLAAQIVSSKSASAPAGEDTKIVQSQADLNMIDPRSNSLKSNNLAYDDYFQRHASEYSAISNYDDYFQRHASEYSATPVRQSQRPGHSFGVP